MSRPKLTIKQKLMIAAVRKEIKDNGSATILCFSKYYIKTRRIDSHGEIRYAIGIGEPRQRSCFNHKLHSLTESMKKMFAYDKISDSLFTYVVFRGNNLVIWKS